MNKAAGSSQERELERPLRRDSVEAVKGAGGSSPSSVGAALAARPAVSSGSPSPPFSTLAVQPAERGQRLA